MLICRVVGRQSITKWNLANVSPLQQLKSVKVNVTCTVVAATANICHIFFTESVFYAKIKNKNFGLSIVNKTSGNSRPVSKFLTNE